MKQDEFIKKYLPFALDVQQKYGVPASVTLAQAIEESGWGSSTPGNNFFGVKATKGWKGRITTTGTTEMIGGKRTPTVGTFRAYDSVEDSFNDYGKVVSGKLYQPLTSKATNSFEFAKAVADTGYAGNPDYYQNISSHMKKYNLTQYDTKFSDKDNAWQKYVELRPDTPGDASSEYIYDNVTKPVLDSVGMPILQQGTRILVLVLLAVVVIVALFMAVKSKLVPEVSIK